ncbi:hypothetical protein ACOSQ3_018313 [Xanthoceras sorbifolium]
MVPYVCADSEKFHSVENAGEVAGDVVLKKMYNDMRAFLAGGLYSGLDQLEFMSDNLREVKVGVADIAEAQNR